MRYYVAGPMTGYDKHNFPAFDAAEAGLKKMGFEVISPANLDRDLGVNEDTPFEVAHQRMHELAMADLTALVTQCQGIFMLRGWEKSVGARAEHAVALWLGHKISYQE